MASALINNTFNVYFASVLGMEHEGMVSMFEALLETRLTGFLGCSSAIFETALVVFFHNASVRDGMVVSMIQGKEVAISEELFSRTFELPLEGLTDLYEVPQDLVLEARRAFSYDGKLFSTSSKKREMVFEFRLLNYILARSVTVKAGSFDSMTHERFLMMTAIYGGVPAKWGRLLLTLSRKWKMASFTAPKQFLKEALRSGEDDDMSWFKQPSKIIEPGTTETDKDIEPVGTEDLSLAKSAATMTDSEDTGPLIKALEPTYSTKSDEDSMSIEDILKHILADLIMPSMTAAEPTRINFALGIEIPRVNEGECLRKLVDLDSVKDIIVKENQLLAWAEIDSLETAVRRREYIISKYREILLQKIFEAHRQNFNADQPTTAIDLQIIVLISNAHLFAFENLQNQMSIHGLKDIVSVGTVVDVEVDPADFVGIFRRGLDVQLVPSDSSSSSSSQPDPISPNDGLSQRHLDTALISPNPSISIDSRIFFTTDYTPLGVDQILLPSAVTPQDFNELLA
ncbi:splicing factor 3B subunit 1-like [Dorcoceras hygrometricum]|uniref:Splicing factor 3B subunit 1-like n=1 Tax=Dorcoceras hygrometricum TaxID=472368 RepID=A0A2Z7AMB1_9LAMI|nr:splicing factor 3B subunit 1-like [Dorcoceras hygrometricum]